jgi:phenylacetate-CoA ligase
MTRTTRLERQSLGTLSDDERAGHQLGRLNALLDTILPGNAFYAAKLGELNRPLRSLEKLASLPYTLKDELLEVPPGGMAANLTYPLERYVRFHQTSGTRGRPLMVLDTAEDWHWWMNIWQYVFDAAGLEPGDRVLLAFSFGPFVGFWSAFDAVIDRGCLTVPGGGMSTLGRLELMRSAGVRVLLCTPSYALHMAETAAQHAIDLPAVGVRKIVVAGEPGGSTPAIRARIEAAWGAELFDHAGASEIGPWGAPAGAGRGLQVVETEFIAEFRSLATGESAAEGELSELVLTCLGRPGCPMLRYRTGDLVRPIWNHGLPSRFVLLEGGVLGRADDMMIVRGVNVFPSSVEQIVRSFPEVAEYRLTVRKVAEMDELELEIEDRLGAPERVAHEVRTRLGLRVEVRCAELGSLPRFEGKGRRFVDLRKSNP